MFSDSNYNGRAVITAKPSKTGAEGAARLPKEENIFSMKANDHHGRSQPIHWRYGGIEGGRGNTKECWYKVPVPSVGKGDVADDGDSKHSHWNLEKVK